MLDLLMQIGSGATLRDAERAICEAACEIVGSRECRIFMYDVDAEELVSKTRMDRRGDDIVCEPTGENLIGYVYGVGETVMVSQLERGEQCEWDLSFLGEGMERTEEYAGEDLGEADPNGHANMSDPTAAAAADPTAEPTAEPTADPIITGYSTPTDASPPITPSSAAAPTGVTGFIAAPILNVSGTPMGVIIVFNKTSQDCTGYTEYDVFSIEQIAQFSSNAFRSWQAIEEARHAKVSRIYITGEAAPPQPLPPRPLFAPEHTLTCLLPHPPGPHGDARRHDQAHLQRARRE